MRSFDHQQDHSRQLEMQRRMQEEEEIDQILESSEAKTNIAGTNGTNDPRPMPATGRISDEMRSGAKSHFENMESKSTTNKGFDGFYDWESKSDGTTTAVKYTQRNTQVVDYYAFPLTKVEEEVEITSKEKIGTNEKLGGDIPSIKSLKTKDHWVTGTYLYEGSKEDFYKGIIKDTEFAIKKQKTKIYEVIIFVDLKGEASKELEIRLEKIVPEEAKIRILEKDFGSKWEDAILGFKVEVYFRVQVY